jgi:hypothetical protein
LTFIPDYYKIDYMTQIIFKLKKSKRKSLTLCFSLLAVLLLFVACDKRGAVRKYKERVPGEPTTSPPKQKVPAETGAKAGPYHWDTPEGWSEVPKTSSMRLATFAIKSQGKQAICTIIPLRGEAGGLKANVTRWLGQVTGSTGPPGDTDKVSQLLDKQERFLTKGQFPAVLIDYTMVTSNPSDPSIMAAVITVYGNSVFIKMMGEKSLLKKNKTKFKALCQSFTFKPGT